MKLVTPEKKITRAELGQMSHKMFGGLVKAVVDIERRVMVVDAEMHADEERELLEQGSRQTNLWGINFYPDQTGETFIEFDSMINLRPGQGNRSRGVDDSGTRNKIREAVDRLVES